MGSPAATAVLGICRSPPPPVFETEHSNTKVPERSRNFALAIVPVATALEVVIELAVALPLTANWNAGVLISSEPRRISAEVYSFNIALGPVPPSSKLVTALHEAFLAAVECVADMKSLLANR